MMLLPKHDPDAMFKGGQAAYLDGVSRGVLQALSIDAVSKDWALRGWDKAKADNEALQRAVRRVA